MNSINSDICYRTLTPTSIHDSGSDSVDFDFDSTNNGWHTFNIDWKWLTSGWIWLTLNPTGNGRKEVNFDWNGWQFQLQMAMVENKLTSNNNGRQEVEFDW